MVQVETHPTGMAARAACKALAPSLLGLVVLLLNYIYVPAANAATLVERYRFHGTVVSASFYDYDYCSEWTRDFTADRNRVTYVSSSRNTCPGEESGSIVGGEAVPTTFTVDRNTVHVVARIRMTNLDTGEPAGRTLLDETFTCTSRPDRYASTSWRQLPGDYRIFERSIGTRCAAWARGTHYFNFADITNARSFTLGIYRD